MEIIESEIRQIFASVVWNHKIHEKQCDINSKHYNFLEFVRLLSSVITTSGLLTCIFIDEFYVKLVTTIVSAISMFVTAFCKTYNIKDTMQEHKVIALEFLQLKNEIISILSEIKIKRIDEERAIEKRNKVLDKYHTLCKKSLNTTDKAVKLASKALKEQRDNTFDDKEIDSYLPIELRKEK
ncbi:MAG: SLATT domain-containing protein [Clostridia bacterium]|nr:SLATT domain-containing protein [Clostridia bacterium]